MSGVGIWTDRQNQKGGREGGLTGSVGVGRVAIFNALKGMPSPLSPSPCERMCTRARWTKSRLILFASHKLPFLAMHVQTSGLGLIVLSQ